MAPLLSAPLLRTQSDRRLVALAADGHDRAFEAIVERYRGPLQRYLRRLLSEPLAEDVLQASFVRAWQALRAGTEVRDLRPWLYRIAHNQALNTLRAAGSALPPVAVEPAVTLEAEVERREELRHALSGIQALPDRQRAALLAIAVDDRPHADVARELGMSDGALRQLLLRARTTLRAAATVFTPYPLMSWLAGGQEATAARVAEVAAGAGGAGVAVKASAAVLAAGAVVAGGPALRDEHAPVRATPAAAAEAAHRQAAPRTATFVSDPVPSADHQAGDQGGALDDHTGQVQRAASSGEHSSSGHGRRGASHRSASSGSGASGEGSSGKSGSDDEADKSGSGGGGGSGEGGDSGDDSSGHSSSGDSGSGDAGDDSEGGGSAKSDSGGSSDSGSGGSGKRQSSAVAVAPAPGAVDDEAPAAAVPTVPAPSGSSESSGSGDSGSAHGDGSGGD